MASKKVIEKIVQQLEQGLVVRLCTIEGVAPSLSCDVEIYFKALFRSGESESYWQDKFLSHNSSSELWNEDSPDLSYEELGGIEELKAAIEKWEGFYGIDFEATPNLYLEPLAVGKGRASSIPTVKEYAQLFSLLTLIRLDLRFIHGHGQRRSQDPRKGFPTPRVLKKLGRQFQELLTQAEENFRNLGEILSK